MTGRRNFLPLVKTFALTKNSQMQLLAFVFFYTGLEQAFWSGVYGTCLANTAYFKTDANALIGINGMGIGVGEILGGVAFGLLGSKTVKYGRSQIVILGFIVHVLAFFLVFINIPNEAPLNSTSALSYITPSKTLAIACSFLLGLGDSCYNTQIYAVLGSLFSTESAPAFALFKFFQSLSCAASLYYSGHLALMWQLLIMVVFSFIATVTFIKVENVSMSNKLLTSKDI